MKKTLMMILLCLAMISFAFPRDIFEIAKKGTPEEMKAAIETGADIAARADDGWTPLHIAATYNTNPEVITTLIKAGADIEARTDKGLTPLHTAAARNSNPEVLLVLLKLGANTKARDKGGYTPWDFIQRNEAYEALKNTKAYWALNDARHE